MVDTTACGNSRHHGTCPDCGQVSDDCCANCGCCTECGPCADCDTIDALAEAKRVLEGRTPSDYRDAGYRTARDAARAMLGNVNGHRLTRRGYQVACDIVEAALWSERFDAQGEDRWPWIET